MSMWRIEPADDAHISFIADNMREADQREIWASSRHTPDVALRKSLELSALAWTCFVDGTPAFMWGVAGQGGILSEAGAPWLLGTDAIYKVSREFLRQSRAYVDRMQALFPRLENHVHAGNALSIRWLTWCGFTLDEAPVRINGEEFFMFRRDADA